MGKTLLLFFCFSFLHPLYFSQSPGNPGYSLNFVKINGQDSVEHFTSFYENGRKKVERYWKKGHCLDTLKHCNNAGDIYHLEVYSDSGYMEVDYFKGFREEGSHKEILTAPEIKIIGDSSIWTRYVVGGYERKPYYIRTGVWKIFYETGLLRAQGKYLPETFNSSEPGNNVIKKGFEPEDWYFLGGAKFSGFYAGGEGYLKDGQWIYYNEIGNEIYREFYKDGLKRK